MEATLSRQVQLSDGRLFTLTPPRGWALDLIASNGVDYLHPVYPVDQVAPNPDGGEPLRRTVYSPVPPDMTTARLTGITMAALLSQADGLTPDHQPVHVWTPEEVLEIIPAEAMEAFAVLCSDLVHAAFPDPVVGLDPRLPRAENSRHGDARPSTARSGLWGWVSRFGRRTTN
jgi:hypothetical protein